MILHNALNRKTEFQLSEGIRPWGILMIISAGEYTLTFPETGHSCTLHPNEASYIPPNTFFVRRIVNPIDFHQFAFRIEQDHPFCRSLHPGKLTIPHTQVAAILKSLTLSMVMPEYTELVRYELEHILKENYLFTGQASFDSLSADIRRVVTYMEEHLAEKMELDALAAMAFLSRTGLIWKFQRQVGKTPQQYWIMLRMQLAKQLLLEGELPIAQIAERCGYASTYYFSNAFRQNSGMSPTHYRKSHLDPGKTE